MEKLQIIENLSIEVSSLHDFWPRKIKSFIGGSIMGLIRNKLLYFVSLNQLLFVLIYLSVFVVKGADDNVGANMDTSLFSDSKVISTEKENTGSKTNDRVGKNQKEREGWFGTKICRPESSRNINYFLKQIKGDGGGKSSTIFEKCGSYLNEIVNAKKKVEVGFQGINPTINLIPTLQAVSNLKKPFEAKIDELIKIASIEKKFEVGTERMSECGQRGEETDYLCCESSNPQSLEIRNMIGSALPVLSGLSSKLACSKFQKVITAVGGLMTTWNISCAAKKSHCENACQDAVVNFKDFNAHISSFNLALSNVFSSSAEIKSAIEKAIKDIRESAVSSQSSIDTSSLNVLHKAILTFESDLGDIKIALPKCADFSSNLMTAVEAQAKQCQAWGKDIATSLVGIGGLILQAKQKSKCGPAEEPNTCNPAAPTAATCAAFCADAANKSNPACRCILNPLASGCMDGSGRGYANGGGGGNYNSMNFNKPGAMAPGNDTTTNPAPEFGGPSSGVAGGGGRGGGGGGGLGGGSVLGSSSKPSGAGAAGKGGSRIDPNVISGFEGGGGASGGSKAGGGYGANSAMMDKLKSELKAKADKLRGLASEDDPRLQITGAGGKTNWEKISDRYRDMTGQMIKDD